jgi:spore coat protein U-like protein
MRLMRLFTALLALIAATALLSSPAQAQVRQCTVTAQSAPVLFQYDPFNPTALNLTNVSITFTRSNGPGGAKPSVIDMYIQSSNSGANGMQLIPISVIGNGTATGLGQNIFYDTPGPVPNLTVPLPASPVAGVLRWNYSGNNAASDVFVVNFNVNLPPNLNLESSNTINFDIQYGCDGTGGGPPFSERNVAPNAFTLQIHVKSGLQASFVGPALNFGEVGDKTDAQALLLPPVAGNIRVASSGPYDISMTSASGYRMTYSGGNVATETQNLRYQVNFLGQSRSQVMTPATPITRTCLRAGLGSPPLSGGVLLPVSVQLLEGGDDEAPSGSYSDTLDVTLTPLVALGQGVACP